VTGEVAAIREAAWTMPCGEVVMKVPSPTEIAVWPYDDQPPPGVQKADAPAGGTPPESESDEPCAQASE
jgi:hypothetical protein